MDSLSLLNYFHGSSLVSYGNPHYHKQAYLADMVPENGLILCTPNVSLEPGLWLAIIGNLQSRGSITDLWEVRHCVPDCNGSINATIPSEEEKPLVHKPTIHLNEELAAKAVTW